MINRKGPFGCYATETLTQGVSVSEYAMAVIGGSDTDCFLPCIINRYGDILEFSFDYSGLIPISEFRRLSSDGKRKFPNILKLKGRLRKRRIAVGTFLLKIVSVLNDLIPAEGIELSPKHIYTNSEGTDLKCCYRPAVYKDSKMRLSSVDPHKMETLISTDFFSQVLTEDEKQTILHAISTGDEEMYYSICKILMSCQGQISRHESSANDRTRKTLGSFDKSMSVRTDLILPALVCVCALYSYISVGRKAALVFVFAGLLLTFRIIYKDRDAAGAKRSSSKEESNSQGDLRRRILFSKTSPRHEVLHI